MKKTLTYNIHTDGVFLLRKHSFASCNHKLSACENKNDKKNPFRNQAYLRIGVCRKEMIINNNKHDVQ